MRGSSLPCPYRNRKRQFVFTNKHHKFFPISNSTLSTTEIVDGPKPKRPKARKILSLSGVHKKRNYRIDEADFDAVKDILTAYGIQENLPIEIHKHVSLIGRGRRVDRLSFSANLSRSTTILHPSIGRLQCLTVLDLDFKYDDGLLYLPEEIGDLRSLIKLSICGSGISTLPASIGRLQNLQEIFIDSFHRDLKCLPKEIGDLRSLIKLTLIDSGLNTLPSSIGRLQNLKAISILGAPAFYSLPKEIGDLQSLETLTLTQSRIKTLPGSIGRLDKLKSLYVKYSLFLSSLPDEIGDLQHLETLSVRLKTLPGSIGRLDKLKSLDLSESDLLSLPEEIGDLKSLRVLDLWGSGITSLPSSIGRLQNLKMLRLSRTRALTSLPEEIGDLKSLRVLNLWSSGITSLPSSIGRLQNLERLDLCWTSSLASLPEEIGGLTSLRKLTLSNGGITSLPSCIGKLKSLETLDLSADSRQGSHLESLPEEIGDLWNLTNLRLFKQSIHVRKLPAQFWFRVLIRRSKLYRNRFLLSASKDSTGILVKLWPHLLSNAERFYNDTRWVKNSSLRHRKRRLKVEAPDAIYQLLTQCMGSFAPVVSALPSES